jgi:hypothetical protein
MNLELNDAERNVLLDVLHGEFGRLRAEIYRTEAAEFKEELKSREAALEAVIQRLEGGAGPGGQA